MYVDSLQNAAGECQGKLGLVLVEQAVCKDDIPIKEPVLSICKDECRTKKKKTRRMEDYVSGIGKFGSSSLPSPPVADDPGVKECEPNNGVSSMSTVKEKKRSMRSTINGVLVTVGGNKRNRPRNDGRDHHSKESSVKLLKHDVSADKMFVELPSSEIGTHRKKHGKQKDHAGQAIRPTNKDKLVTGMAQPDIVISDEKNNGSKSQGNSSAGKGQNDAGLSEDVRPSRNALQNNDPTSLSGCSTHSVSESSLLQNCGQCDIIQGKRFSKEEDELIKDAVFRYIERHKLGKEGLDMVLNCQRYPQIRKGCWKEIAASIPWRLYRSVRNRAEKLFLNDVGHQWTPEEIELVKKYGRERGTSWKSVADLFGVYRQQAWRVWRRHSNVNLRLGPWSQDEYQELFALVHKDLRKKMFTEKNDKCGMLRENISWHAISSEMGTRFEDHLCLKWYRSLSSSMVGRGLWSETDDYRLVDSLSKVDACCVEDVDWDNLLNNRSGDICRKRWVEMTKYIGGNIKGLLWSKWSCYRIGTILTCLSTEKELWQNAPDYLQVFKVSIYFGSKRNQLELVLAFICGFPDFTRPAQDGCTDRAPLHGPCQRLPSSNLEWHHGCTCACARSVLCDRLGIKTSKDEVNKPQVRANAVFSPNFVP